MVNYAHSRKEKIALRSSDDFDKHYNEKDALPLSAFHFHNNELDDDSQKPFLPTNSPRNRGCTRDQIFKYLRISLAVILLVGACVFLGFLFGSDVIQNKSVSALEWLKTQNKFASGTIVALLYCVGLVFFCPGTPFNLAAGFLYGLWGGFGVAMTGCVLGATVAFICGRTIAREWVKTKMESRPTFRAVDWAIQKNGIYIVFLTRLSPLFPFPLLNYAFGITKVRVWQYFVGTAAGVFPATIAYTYLGTLMRNITDIWDDDSSSGNQWVYMLFGALLTALSIVVISIITKRAINKATAEYEQLVEEGKDGSLRPLAPKRTESNNTANPNDVILDVEKLESIRKSNM